jgi:hypothetical protein
MAQGASEQVCARVTDEARIDIGVAARKASVIALT